MAQLVDQWHRARRAPDGSLVPTDRYGRGRRWAVRYRDPSGRQRTESFDRKSDAERRLAEISHTIMRGFWVDPALGRTRTGDWLTDWLAANEGRWRATTAAKRRQLVRDWYAPSFGDVPIGNLRTSMVQSAVSGWQAVHAAGTVAHALTVLRQALDAAVDDGLIARNPAARVQRRPSRRRREV